VDLSLTDTQVRVRDTARHVTTEHIAPTTRERGTAGRIGPELRRRLGGLGLLAPEVPVELGGGGLDRVASGLITEEVGRGDVSVAYLQVVASLVGQILVENAAPALASRWLPRMCDGSAIVAIGLTEPHAGSDAGVPRLTATPDGDEFVLDGVKSASFAGEADAIVVFARTGPSRERGRDISALVVPLDLPGVRRELYTDLGTSAVNRGAVHFSGVRVGRDHLLGELGAGFSQVMRGFDFSRALIGLQVLGAAQQSIDETWAYVSRREAFDEPLSRKQGVVFPLAEAETLVAAARWQCYRTLWLKDVGEPHTTEAAMCKWWAPTVAYDAITQCLLLHGQYGYRTDLPLEQRLRDVLGLRIGDGTAQIMKLVIARQRLGRELAP
jgi:cyclohexanecarboxyl-CoA dehydrogenase